MYIKALAPLGIKMLVDEETLKVPNKLFAGFGREGKPEFWIGQGKVASTPIHIAFVAESRNLVDEFYQAALAAGGKDNGKPGIREIYHPNYYGAFVLDFDGNNIEAVCHRGQE